jgi:hypothetical protein
MVPQAVTPPTGEITNLGGAGTLEVVGESHYQDALWALVGGVRDERVRQDVTATLMAESNNPYDANAVSVWINNTLVGYLRSDEAEDYRPGLLELQETHGSWIALRGVIVGGGIRGKGRGMLGVFLEHDPSDFGIESDDPASNWIDKLPQDNGAAIVQLRDHLTNETDPVTRHFAYNELESRLYKSRDIFSSALDDYDTACDAHDREMEAIRTALIGDMGGVPNLPIYRQMCIRQQKDHDWDKVRWWAQRGLEIYGSGALRPQDVEDLNERLSKANAHLRDG